MSDGRVSSIDEVLDRAVAAINRGDRVAASALAEQVLAVDAGNAEAEDLLTAPGDAGEIRRLTILFAWRRLKQCHNPDCRSTFYDRSKNTSGVWHSVKVCGNAANLRASRARRRERSVSTDHPIDLESPHTATNLSP